MTSRDVTSTGSLISAFSLAFLGYPEEVRRHIYSTNMVETRCAWSLGYFSSQDALEVNLFIQVVNLQDRWWRRAVRAKSYELRLLFALRYELDEEAVDALHNF